MKTLRKLILLVGLLCSQSLFADNLTISDFSIKAGETKTISVILNNTAHEYTALEFYIKLPAGVSVLETDGELSYFENVERLTSKNHSMEMSYSQGVYHVLIYSNKNKAILGTSGALFTMEIQADANMTGGTYQGQLIGQKLETPDKEKFSWDDVSFNITVESEVVSQEQSLSLTSLPSMTYGDGTYTLPAKTNEGLTLTWTSSNTSVASISGNMLTIKGAGSATITAYQAGNSNYNPYSKSFSLTVAKAILTVTANNCNKMVGEDNPAFTLSYSGFKNSDSVASLTQQPTATCSAGKNSPAGTYTITVSGGQSNNYTFNYVNGTLTIVDSSAEDVDLTRLIGISQDDWHAQGTTSSEFAPYVTTNDGRTAAMTEHYEWNIDMLGELMYQELEGLENGEYEVKVYANAYFTDGRGFSSDIYSGQRNLAYVFANESRTYLSAHIGTAYSASDVYTIYAHVSDGRLRIGLTVEKRGANWYTLQIKSLKLLKKGTVVYADAKSKVYGNSNPTLTYTIRNMTTYQGTPSLSCNATTSSPAGTYIIDVNTGSMSSGENIYAQPGYMIVVDNGSAKAIWCAGNNTLFFINTSTIYSAGDTYNGQTITNVWAGSNITNSGNSAPVWNSTVKSTLQKVVFDSSFAVVTPTSLHDWLANCQQLSSITGLEYLNTSNVTNMQGMFYMCSSLTNLDVTSFNTSNVTNMQGIFQGCSTLTNLDVSHFNTSKVENMAYLFRDCSSLTSLDVSHFDTSNVTNMMDMFFNCHSLTSLDVSNFNTSNVITMTGMFNVCSGLTSLDVSNFDTSKVTNMYYMFAECSGLTSLDLRNFNTSNVTDMGSMFQNCSNLRTIYCNDYWYCSSSSNMFNGCVSLVGGQGMNYNSSATSVSYANPGPNGYFTEKGEAIPQEQSLSFTFLPSMTYGDGTYTLPTKTNEGLTLTWQSDNTSVATISGNTLTIKGAGNANITATQAGNSNYAAFSRTFSLTVAKAVLTVTANNCSKTEGEENPAFTLSYSGFKYSDSVASLTQQPTATCSAGKNSPAGTYTITVSGGQSNNYTFKYVNGTLTIFPASMLPQVLWCSGNATLYFINDTQSYKAGEKYNGQTITSVWSGTTITNSGNSNPAWNNTVNSSLKNVVFNPSFASVRPKSLYGWFYECRELTTITGLEYLNTSNVTDMSYLFYICPLLEYIDVSHFNTGNVTTMRSMFDACSGVKKLDLHNFDTSKVTDMGHMFVHCEALQELNISSFNTSNVTDMANMFYRCNSLISLDVTNFNTSKVTNMYRMFYNDYTLTQLDLSNFDTSKVSEMYGMFYNCSNLKTIYCNDSWSCSSSYDMFTNCTSLVGGQGMKYSSSKTDATYANPGKNGYFTKTGTGIDAIGADGELISDGIIYDLSGRPVGDASKQKFEELHLQTGVYILNGKKIMVK